MIRVLAIDDEPLALKQLASYIQKVPFLQLAGECVSAQEAREKMDEETIDALFIDINMPDLNGLDFVRSLAMPPLIVFTTAYSQYAVEGYKVDAVDYLLKPFTLDELQRAALKIKAQYELRQAAEASVSPADEDDALFVKTEHRIISIHLTDVAYIEGMSEYLKIHFITAAKPITVLLSMRKLEERLPKNFMRIHRSYIINLRCIQEVNKNRVILHTATNDHAAHATATPDTAYLPIGDLYRDSFLDYLKSKFLVK